MNMIQRARRTWLEPTGASSTASEVFKSVASAARADTWSICVSCVCSLVALFTGGSGPAAPAALAAEPAAQPVSGGPIGIGSRRELFVDRFLIDRLENTQLKLHEPVSGGLAIRIDKP
jgi:hypothetical protein